MGLAVLFLLLCFSATRLCAQESHAGRGIRVVTTIFPLWEFAREVGGQDAEVELLLPPGVEPHAFEPTPGDVARINEADIFIYTGAEMEPWAQRLLPGITNQNLQIIDASQGRGLLSHGDRPEEGGPHGHADPHIWLDFSIDLKIVDSIAEALIERNGDRRDVFLANAETYKAKLSVLDEEYRRGLKDCASRTIVSGGHFAFGHLAQRYGLKAVSPYEGFSPNAEPSPRAVAELVTLVRSTGAKYVFYEELVSPRVTQVLAEETGAEPALLHAAHNLSADEFTRGVTFLSIMEENLKQLRKALQCQ